MKLRDGFVSNSSSSSFIVKTEKSKDDIYQDIFDVCQEYIRHREFLENREKNDLRETYTIDNIKKHISIKNSNTEGVDRAVKNWYKEDCNFTSKDFKDTVVIYDEYENFLPADMLDDFILSRSIYSNEYKYVAGCGHMG